MDATTPPRGDDEPTRAEPAAPPPLVEPARPRGAGSSAVGPAAATSGLGREQGSPPTAPTGSERGPDRVPDDGLEDPTAPDTAVEATLTTEPAGARPEEPVLPTSQPDEVQVAPATRSTPAAADAAVPAPPATPADAPAAPVQQAPASVAAAPQASASDTPAQNGPPPTPIPAPDAAAHAAPDVAPPRDPAHTASLSAPGHEVVYVAAPTPPKKKGNRGIGVLLAALSTVLFFALYVGVVLLINMVQGRGSSPAFLQNLSFYIPVLLFAIGFIVLALIVNRAGWWTFVLGSFFVGAFVYLGTVGLLLLSEATRLTPDAAVAASRQLLISPLVIAAGLVAREVALWVGAGISARGRRVKARNAEARARFDREQAEHRAEIERAGVAVRPA